MDANQCFPNVSNAPCTFVCNDGVEIICPCAALLEMVSPFFADFVQENKNQSGWNNAIPLPFPSKDIRCFFFLVTNPSWVTNATLQEIIDMVPNFDRLFTMFDYFQIPNQEKWAYKLLLNHLLAVRATLVYKIQGSTVNSWSIINIMYIEPFNLKQEMKNHWKEITNANTGTPKKKQYFSLDEIDIESILKTHYNVSKQIPQNSISPYDTRSMQIPSKDARFRGTLLGKRTFQINPLYKLEQNVVHILASKNKQIQVMRFDLETLIYSKNWINTVTQLGDKLKNL